MGYTRIFKEGVNMVEIAIVLFVVLWIYKNF